MGESKEQKVNMAATVAATEAIVAPRIEIVGERRRAYDEAFRARMVAESLQPGVRVGILARRHGICASLIYRWRREAEPEAIAPSAMQLVPVRLHEAEQAGKAAPIRLPAARSSPAETIEIELEGGVRLRVSERIGTVALRRIVAALRG